MGVEILFPFIFNSKFTNPIKTVKVDDFASQVNRYFMFYLSLIFAIAITIRQQLGGPVIACDGLPDDRLQFAEDWCWAKGIYTMKEAYEMSNKVSPYPGILPEDLPPCVEYELYGGGHIECPQQHEIKPFTRIYHSWYPLSMHYFWLMALLFFLPYKFYKLWGFDDVKPVVEMLQNPVEDGFEKAELIKRGSIWLYLHSPDIISVPSFYSYLAVRHSMAWVALGVKMIYILNILGIYLLTHKMFKFGSFAGYGLLWKHPTPLGNVNSLIQEKLFPKVAACELKRYGASGDLEEYQGMCMLALNILNQYIFLLYWWCLVGVLVINCVSFCSLLVRVTFPIFWVRHFIESAGLDRHPGLKEISKLYLHSGSSLRILMEIFSYNIEPKLLGEILVNCYLLLKQDLDNMANGSAVQQEAPPHNSEQDKRSRIPALLKVFTGLKMRGKKNPVSQKYDPVSKKSQNNKKQSELKISDGIRKSVPILLLNDELMSMNSSNFD